MGEVELLQGLSGIFLSMISCFSEIAGFFMVKEFTFEKSASLLKEESGGEMASPWELSVGLSHFTYVLRSKLVTALIPLHSIAATS